MFVIAMPIGELLFQRAYLHYIDTEVADFKDSGLNLLWTILGPISNIALPALYGLDAVEIAIYFILELWYVDIPTLWLWANELKVYDF